MTRNMNRNICLSGRFKAQFLPLPWAHCRGQVGSGGAKKSCLHLDSAEEHSLRRLGCDDVQEDDDSDEKQR